MNGRDEIPTADDNPWLRRLPILVLSHAAGTLNVVSVMAMAPVIRGELGLSAALFGTFVSAYYGAQAVGSLPAGGVTDRFGIGRALVVAHVTMIIGAVIVDVHGAWLLHDQPIDGAWRA